MPAVRASIELSIKPPIDAIRAKPALLTECALELSDTALASLGVSVGSPLGPCPGGVLAGVGAIRALLLE
jgi:hypothetical protein